MRRTQLLNGNRWRFRALPPERLSQPAVEGGPTKTVGPNEMASVDSDTGWLPAQVPGNVRADLWRLDKIPDPHLSPQESEWVDRHAWCYATELHAERRPGERLHLIMEGVDYLSWTYLDDRLLSSPAGHEGMFSRQLYEITDLLAGESVLAVVVQGSDHLGRERRSTWERLLDQVEPGPAHQRKERFQTLKCQMSFGWDFAPCLRTMGLWDDVRLIRSGDVFIRDLWVSTTFERDAVLLCVSVAADTGQGGTATFRLSLAGHNFDSPPQVEAFRADLQAGSQVLSWTVPVRDPRLWWPWDHGRPNLYRCTVEAYLADGRLSDVATEMVGLREITLAPNPGAPPGRRPWVFHVNGVPVYVRGANWVPADILPGTVRAKDYQSLLQMARDANMNALRVWGGGLREKRAFYELCDEMGLLLWQEFPFACAFVTHYPQTGEYLDLAERECQDIVRALRSHPSLALWCSGNEFHPGRHRSLVDRLGSVVEREDGTRPFVPASPHAGDVHNWDVWHGLAPVSDYKEGQRASGCQFASEYGLQAPPVVESLRAFIPPDELWPPGPSWRAHGAQPARLERYARPMLPGQERGQGSRPPDLDAFVRASQRAQAVGLQIAIEHLRRQKHACSGTLLWQLNEPWPAICWSLVDHYGRPKPAYEAVRRAYNPLLVSLEYPLRRYDEGDLLVGTVWVINDRRIDYPGCWVELTLSDAAGEVHEMWLHTMRVRADSARAVGQVEWALPEGGAWWAIARLYQGEEPLAESEYDLSFYDSYKMPLIHRLSRGIARLAMDV